MTEQPSDAAEQQDAAADRGPYTCPGCGRDYEQKDAVCSGTAEAGHATLQVVKYPPPDDYALPSSEAS